MNKIINEISKIRAKNNKAWMSLLKLAFKHSPKEAGKIFKDIQTNDVIITKLSIKLIGETND